MARQQLVKRTHILAYNPTFWRITQISPVYRRKSWLRWLCMTNLWILQTNVMAWRLYMTDLWSLQTEVIFGAAEHDNRL